MKIEIGAGVIGKTRFLAKRHFALALLCGIGLLVPVSARCQQSESAVSDRSPERQAWRDSMRRTPVQRNGCFKASYPSTAWEEVQCEAAPRYRSKVPKTTNRAQVVGNGYDYVAQAPSGYLFSSAVGSFPTVLGVTSETGVGVPAFNDQGYLGANDYSLQVNTNFYYSAPPCNGYSSCSTWQQYVMATNANGTNDTEVFIEYWLLDYGTSSNTPCPSGYQYGGQHLGGLGVDCFQNTPSTLISNGQLPITDLSSLTLSGSATANGIDTATVTFDGSAYTRTVNDSYTDIASGWNQAEFNVFGDAGGSQAVFNNNVSISVNLDVTGGSMAAPTCLPPSSYSGTTGETNNLNLGSPCTASGGSTPSIQFVETLGTPPTPGILFSPSPVSFTTAVGTTSTSQTVTVTNETGVNLTNFALTDSDSTNFLITSPTCTSNFAYGASCTFKLACYPTTAGTLNASIVGAGNGYSATLPLSCAGFTQYLPTVANCSTSSPYGNGTVSNPDGPLTPQGGYASLSSFRSPSYLALKMTCRWSGFPSYVTTGPATLNFGVGFDTLGSGSIAQAGSNYGVFSTNPPSGNYSVSIPVGTNLNTLDVDAEAFACQTMPTRENPSPCSASAFISNIYVAVP